MTSPTVLSALLLLAQLSSQNEAPQLTLQFVHALWRHGDRSPSITFPTDPIQEGNWSFGEGGFGVLTPLGMEQHFRLGQILRQRYIDTAFLSRQYQAKEAQIYASKIVRTQLSAASNALGMYGEPRLRGIAFPDIQEWPAGYSPIAIGILEEASDALLNCPRSHEFLSLVKQSEEYRRLQEDKKVQWMLAELTSLTGIPASLDLLELFFEPLNAEAIHFPDTLSSWCSTPLLEAVLQTFARIDELRAGVGYSTAVKGVDLAYEIPLLQGGYFIRMITQQMRQKLQGSDLKFYAVSAHDQELNGVVALLGIKEKLYFGRPQFAATALFELYTDALGNPLVKMLYRPDSSTDFSAVTHLIPECGSDLCPLEIFEMLSRRFDPGNLAELCNTPLFPTKADSRAKRVLMRRRDEDAASRYPYY